MLWLLDFTDGPVATSAIDTSIVSCPTTSALPVHGSYRVTSPLTEPAALADESLDPKVDDATGASAKKLVSIDAS